MSTSLKTIPGRQLRGMHQLKSKILDLQTQYQSLLKERQENITAIIATLDLASLEDPLLIGGLLFIKEKITGNDSILEAWRDAGEKFLRRSKNKPCPGKDEEQARDFLYPYKNKRAEQTGVHPQIQPEKNISLKQTPPPQTTPQSSQKQPQSREA